VWSWSSVPGAYWAAFMRQVQNDPVSPFNAAWQAQIVAILGSGTTIQTIHYGTEPDAAGAQGNTAIGMPINHIAGSTPTQTVTYTGTCSGTNYGADSDPGPIPVYLTMAIEGWPFGGANSDNRVDGLVTVNNGSTAVTGSGTNFTTWLQAGDHVCFANVPAFMPTTNVIYTIASIADDTHLALASPYGEANLSSGQIYGPFNRPPTCAQVGLMSGDSRANLLVRNESTMAPDHLWEVWWPTYDAGTGWRAGGGFKFDLTTGAQRPDGATSSCTGGTPCMPLLIRYEDCLAGSINHPIRAAIHIDLGLHNQCIWPCTHAAAAFGTVDYTQGFLPTGTVLRLNAGWLAANIASFPTIIQPILTAMNRYGCHINDYTVGTPLQLDMSQDNRWKKADLLTVRNIPVTAMEVVDCIKPQFTLGISAAPYSTGSAITFTASYVGDDTYYGTTDGNVNFGPINFYVYYSTDAGLTWHNTGATPVAVSPSSRSGTTSWTPSSAGNYLFSLYFGGAYWAPLAVSYTQYNGGGTAVTSQAGIWITAAVSASARSLTTTQAGRWDSPATWGNAAPPAAGDTATVAHDVVMIGDAVIGDGTASTVLSVTTGSLTVVGCALTIRGNASIGQLNAGTVVNRLTVVSSAGNQASLLLDGNRGVTPVVSVQSDTQLTFRGQAGCPVVVATRTGSAGNPGYITDAGTARSFYLDAAYVHFSALGGASQAALVARSVVDVTSPANPPFKLDHCKISGCGPLPQLGLTGITVNFQITNCVWDSLADTTTVGPYSLTVLGALTTGTRLYQHNVTPDGTVQATFVRCQDLTIDDCYFGSMVYTPNVQPPWTVLQNSFLYDSYNYGGADTTTISGDLTDNYCLIGAISTGYFTLCGATGDSTMSGNVIESALTSGDRTQAIFGTGEEGVQRAVHWHNNIVLPTFGGGFTGWLVSTFNNASQSFWTDAYIEHNTQFITSSGGCGVAILIADGSPLTERVNQINSFKSNLIVRIGAATGGGAYAVQNFLSYNPVTNALAAANTDYNGYTALDTVGSSAWSSIAGSGGAHGSGGEVGTVYDTPMAYTTTPGAHDVSLGTASSLVSAGPQFVGTGGLLGFDAHMGGPGTLAHALAALKAQYDPTDANYVAGYTNAALVAWVKSQWTPRASSLLNAGHDGHNIGAT
jgi:hypothetical protein